MDLITYSDGEHDLIDIANIINTPIWELYPIVDILVTHKVLKIARKT